MVQDQRALPHAEADLPLLRDRAAREDVRGRPPRRAAHPARHRRRHAAAGADGRARHARGGRRDGARRHVPRLRSGDGLRVPDGAHRGPRLRRAGRPRGDRRDLRERRSEERHRQHPGDLRGRRPGRAGRPGVPGLRGHERDGRPRGHDRAPTGATPGSSISRPPPRTASARPSRIGRSTSSISATRTTRPGRCCPATCSARGSTGRAGTAPSSSTTPRTRRTSATPTCRTRSSRSRGRGSAPSSSGASRRPPGSPGRAARSPSSRRSSRGAPPSGEPSSLHALWFRRQSTKFNGVPYVVQRGAAASYTDAGRKEVRTAVDFYMENARIIRDGLRAAGFQVYGGENAPYIWVKTPPGLGSWDALRSPAHRGPRRRDPGGRVRAERRGLLPLHRLRPAGPDRGSGRADPHAAPALVKLGVRP